MPKGDSRHPAASLLRQALARKNAGQLDLALALTLEASRLAPQRAEAWGLAGNIALETGAASAAIEYFNKASTLAPDEAAYHGALGAARHAAGKKEAAEGAFRTAVSLAPEDTASRTNLGLLLMELDRPEEAATLFEEGVALAPSDPALQRSLGDALAMAGQRDKAVAAYRSALSLAPGDPTILTNLGGVLRAIGDLTSATVCYEQVLSAHEDAPAWANLSGVRLETGDLDGALDAATRAVALAPEDAVAVRHLGDAYAARDDARTVETLERAYTLDPARPEAAYNLAVFLAKNFQAETALAWTNRALDARTPGKTRESALRLQGIVLRTLGRQDASRQCFDAILKAGRASVTSRFCACLATIPLVYRDEAEIQSCRDAYLRALAALVREQAEHPEAFAAEAASFIGMLQPYYLAYQGLCDREPQESYGRLLHAAHNRAFPELAAPLEWCAPRRGERIKVGIVSGYFRQHSNWKIPIKGWLTHLDRQRFTVYGYATSNQEDARTAEAKALADVFRSIGPSWKTLARSIREDRPDVLLYPEIGMHPETLRLALLRLAPVQCVSWGHPDTSGLPTMDYYLTSERMEPADAAAQYTERLVALPGLSVVYEPLALPPSGASREDFGLTRRQTIFLCPQSLPKYLPRRDELLARIARQVPESRFVFIESWIARGIADSIKERLARAFARHGLDADRHILFLPHMSTARFHDLCRLADIVLDTPDWSGCNSTLEAIEHDLPVITLPGRLMRARHTLAVLSILDCEDLVAATEEAYVQKAVALANTPSERHETANRIARNKNRLYHDLRPVRALEQALDAMIARAGENRGQGPSPS